RAVFSSHGEIMRSVLANFQFNSRDCLLVDEPDAGEDIDGVMRIKNAFEKITKKGCQVIIATHHPFFLKNANLIELEHHYAEKLISLYKNV
ncbi:MAG: hypothetical protein JW774_12495, partial [Candidatus Aureabacteria bacterium]|nr:hypothetical protein [Candidatus Auribacterota bacterium]